MLRFFSRRGKPRGAQKAAAHERHAAKYASLRRGDSSGVGVPSSAEERKRSKHLISCKVILLDGEHLDVDISVGQSHYEYFF